MDIDEPIPVVVTTSRLMSTGVDVPTCKNIVLFRLVNLMTEFKQIIGRGTRVREDKEKLFLPYLITQEQQQEILQTLTLMVNRH